MDCPLCESDRCQRFYADSAREFLRCDRCALVFVPDHDRLEPEAEKRIYDQHQNDPDDHRYRAFLSRLSEPIQKRLSHPAEGLDFGSGPGPTLSRMFEEAGHRMQIYDPFYADDPLVLERQYDFVTASEVVEHLFRPGEEFRRMWDCLRPGGLLGIMTQQLGDRSAFADWYYKNDPTHVCFYQRETFAWIARFLGGKTEFPAEDVVLIQKPGGK